MHQNAPSQQYHETFSTQVSIKPHSSSSTYPSLRRVSKNTNRTLQPEEDGYFYPGQPPANIIIVQFSSIPQPELRENSHRSKVRTKGAQRPKTETER